MTLTIDSVQALTQDAWRSVLGEEVECDAPLPGASPSVTSCVHITGEWDGAVTGGCSRELARTITEAMFGMDDGEAQAADIEDAIGELVNIIGGGLKSMLPGTSMLSLPTVTDGVTMTFPGAEMLVSETFIARGEPLVVSVHQRNVTVPTHEGAPS